MTSPAGAISSAPYRGGAGWTQGYAPAQQTYRYTAPLAAQPAYAYTQHTTTTVSRQSFFFQFKFKFRQSSEVGLHDFQSFISLSSCNMIANKNQEEDSCERF